MAVSSSGSRCNEQSASTCSEVTVQSTYDKEQREVGIILIFVDDTNELFLSGCGLGERGRRVRREVPHDICGVLVDLAVSFKGRKSSGGVLVEERGLEILSLDEIESLCLNSTGRITKLGNCELSGSTPDGGREGVEDGRHSSVERDDWRSGSG